MKLAIVPILIASAAGGGCATTFRESPMIPPEAVPPVLNHELLTPEPRRIQFVVEHMAGHPPEREALNALVELAGRYGGKRASWKQRAVREPVVLEPDASYVFVKYVGNQLRGFGLAYTLAIKDRTIHVIVINQEAHRRFRMLMPQRKLEQQTLVHEYGHLLGLPSKEHGYYPDYPDLVSGLHCVNPECAISVPRWRSILYNAFHVAFGRDYLDDYCAECRAALNPQKRKTSFESKKPR